MSGKKRLPLAAQLGVYRMAHATGLLRPLPINLTVSVTYSCPSRCLTCDIWQKKVEDLSVDEYGKIFPTLEKTPIWVTVSGGDQFIRADLDEIVALIKRQIDPKIVNIPMNGVITERIFSLLPRIAATTQGSQLVLNLSVDEIGTEHDRLRGAPGNWEKLLGVAELIRDLKKTYAHVVLGVHTVISQHNVDRIPEIARIAKETFRPDSYITEVAENRVELKTMEKSIAPSVDDYRRAVAHLKGLIEAKRSRHPVARLVESLRLEYYDLAANVLDTGRQVIDCYAGWASAHLAPDGDLWGCCVRAEPMGNVRDYGYDFGRVWRSPRADEFRRSVRAKECACPLANASYTNLLLDGPSLARVSANMVGIDPVKHVVEEDRGLGTAYERYCFYQLLEAWAAEYGVETFLEGPVDGMAGVAGVHGVGLAKRGVKVVSAVPTEEHARVARGIYELCGAPAEIVVEPSAGGASLPRSDMVLSYHALSFVDDWRAHLAAAAALARKVLVVTVCNPDNWGVAVIRAFARLRGVAGAEAPESWRTDVLAPELWKLGRVRTHTYFDCPWWPDLQVSPGQSLTDRLKKLTSRRFSFTDTPEDSKLAERFAYGTSRWPYFGGPGWVEELLPALLKHPCLEGAQSETVRRRSAHLHGFVVDMRPRTARQRRHLARIDVPG